jgi:hypothetical protein
LSTIVAKTFKGAKKYRRLRKRPSTESATNDRLGVSTRLGVSIRAGGDRCALDIEGGGVGNEDIEAGEAATVADTTLFGVDEASSEICEANKAVAAATASLFGDCEASAELREAKKAFGSIRSRICSENSGPWSPEPKPKLVGAASQ